MSATERSDALYQAWLEASQKFDYFVAGVALALVGYLGANYHLSSLSNHPKLVEGAALVFLLVAAFSGLKRLERSITVLRIMQRRTYEQEGAGALTSVALKGQAILNKSTGEILYPEDMPRRIQEHKIGEEVVNELLDEQVKAAAFWYRIRDKTLIGGLALLIAARALEALQ